MQLKASDKMLVDEESVQNIVTISLAYHPPLDWASLRGHFRSHLLPGLETVTDEWYERVFHLDGETGYFRIAKDAHTESALQLRVVGASSSSLPRIIERVRQMFDLDMNLPLVERAMATQPSLLQLWKKNPGLRIARSWDWFETTIATILGQLVSVSFGRMLIRELMETYGEKIVHPVTGEIVSLFPRPEVLAKAGLLEVRTSVLRRRAINAMAALVVDGTLSLVTAQDFKTLRKTLLAVPGIGAWSAEYIAMRAFGDSDAFPATDYVLKREIKHHAGMDLKLVRPWRAYAAIYLWKRFADTKGESIEPRL
jgi:3-methyladenine DNA glycosylase/8-oxoguanine DNA glycosylase